MPVPKVTNSSNISHLTSSTPGDVCIKFGVELGIEGYEGAPPHFLVLSREMKLFCAIEKLVETWGLPESASNYALTFENGFFVTEGNRASGVENGSVLRLTLAPAILVARLLTALEEQRAGYERLEELCPDPTFIYELLKVKGEALLLRLLLEEERREALAHLLGGIHTLLVKERSWWEARVESLFPREVLLKIHSQLTSGSAEVAVIPAFKILLSLIPVHYALAFEIISIPDVLRFLKREEVPALQRLSIAMINALFKNGSAEDRRTIKKEMEVHKARQLIVDHIIASKAPASREMDHELYLLQTLLLNQLKDRMLTPVASQDQSALEKIKELRKRALLPPPGGETPGSQPRTHRYNQDYKKLGFIHDTDPTKDFRSTPPGTLALDLMYSFCNHHGDQYRKLILENSVRGDEHDCPFAAASIELVKLIVDIVRIGEEPQGDRRYYPMFFTHDNPLEEFFSICILHLHKTWQEMRATREDFSKVMDVSREQINASLRNVPASLADFKERLKSYSEVQKAWAEEAKSRGEVKGKAVEELKRIILPDVQELVRRQRLGYICEGTSFPKHKRNVYVRLNPNHKTLFYGGDWSSSEEPPPLEKLESKIQVSELKDLILSPSAAPSNAASISSSSLASARKSRDASDALAFSIYTENGKSLDLVAPSQTTFDCWTDAINALLGRPLTSREAREDTEKLLAMEIKLRLLDIEGLDIPTEEPEIPPSPPDYDFDFQA